MLSINHSIFLREHKSRNTSPDLIRTIPHLKSARNPPKLSHRLTKLRLLAMEVTLDTIIVHNNAEDTVWGELIRCRHDTFSIHWTLKTRLEISIRFKASSENSIFSFPRTFLTESWEEASTLRGLGPLSCFYLFFRLCSGKLYTVHWCIYQHMVPILDRASSFIYGYQYCTPDNSKEYISFPFTSYLSDLSGEMRFQDFK